MKITCRGPIGVACALVNIDGEYMGMRVRSFRSGKIVSTGMGYGEGRSSRYYINGNRCSRKDFMKRMSVLVADGEEVVIEGNAV